MAKIFYRSGGVTAYVESETLQSLSAVVQLGKELRMFYDQFFSSAIGGEDWTGVVWEQDKYIDDFFEQMNVLQYYDEPDEACPT